ncbi:MAG: hypothetical protein NTZ23_05185 [Cyanobium sp. LacPavin_0920_WC12_MAG_63_22]|nr:hypothetical protein [Cyanobium sp. LacPavin_0920_WC12_MAG_63_22]
MEAKYQGTEKGQPLTPDGQGGYETLLSQTCFCESDDSTLQPDQLAFSVSDKSGFFENSPHISVELDLNVLEAYESEGLQIAVILKEQSSRSSCIAYKGNIETATHGMAVHLTPELFSQFCLTNKVFIDIVVFVEDDDFGLLEKAFKRFSLSFGTTAGYFSIEERDPSYFVARGGGEDTVWLTSVEASDENDLTCRPATDVVKVYVNTRCSRQLEKITNQVNVSGDLVSRMFVASVVSTTIHRMLELCIEYPHTCEDESVASKILDLIDAKDEISYGEFREEALHNPEAIGIKVQNAFDMATAAASFSGK